MNKKGNVVTMIYFFIILFVVLFAGFIMVVGSSVLNYVFDVAVPELSNLGMVGDSNFTEIASFTIAPLDNIIQQFTWLTGVLYVLMLIFTLAIAFTMRSAPSKWLVGFYFVMVLALILGSIYVSNMYEEFYDGDDELATRLKEHTILSFMILYSPTILTFIVFLAGVVLFSGMESSGIFQEEII
tara:strand:+ start:1321 stop:1872 length:552 start_codon:yes stop_codon:yes gene_type:complete